MTVAMPVRELWSQRSLVKAMTVARLKTAHSRTVLGHLWWLLDPILMTLVYTILIGYILQRGAAHPPYPLFLMCGLIAWKGFSSSMMQSIRLISKSEGLISAFRFPRAILPVTMVLSNQMFFVVALGPLAVLAVFYQFVLGYENVHLGPALLWAPAILFVQVVLTLGVCILLSCAGVFFRDLASFMRHTVRVFWYASPGIYGVTDVIPEYDGLASVDFSRIEHFFVLNPFVHIIAGYRSVFMAGERPDLLGLGLTLLASLGLLALALGLFARHEAKFLKHV